MQHKVFRLMRLRQVGARMSRQTLRQERAERKLRQDQAQIASQTLRQDKLELQVKPYDKMKRNGRHAVRTRCSTKCLDSCGYDKLGLEGQVKHYDKMELNASYDKIKLKLQVKHYDKSERS